MHLPAVRPQPLCRSEEPPPAVGARALHALEGLLRVLLLLLLLLLLLRPPRLLQRLRRVSGVLALL